MKIDEKKTEKRRTPSRTPKFPESNHILTQLLILSTALVPMLSYVLQSRWFKFRSFLSRCWIFIRSVIEHFRVPAPLFLTSTVAVAAAAVFVSVFTWGTTVTYGDTTLGIVADETEAAAAIDNVELELATVLGSTFTLDRELVSYSREIVPRSSITEAETVEETLNEQFDLVEYGYALYVDGVYIGTTRTREALEDLLDYLTSAYRNENTISVDFVEKIVIKEGYVSVDSFSNLGDIALLLNSTKAGEVVYTVEKGDVWSVIAQNHGMSNQELLDLNPGFDIDKLQIGDELLISNAVPYLTVKVTQTEQYISDVPYEIEYRDDPNMWQGDTKVISKGVYGKADTVAQVTYVNSEEVERVIVSETILSEPVTEIQARGTAKRPSWAPTGTFRWPTNGNITSYYGWRTIFGGRSYHSGIDIANRKGTDIVAADGGIVTYSGWMSGYGYLICIDHQNGFVSYYGHNSALLVKVGAKVHKGQHIAEMGSTGRSTGNHCHFELRYYGERRNPMNYLP